ncbi:DMT family transporter [Candidatus Puniceispirillum sp.]|nr:DMT family transporter [Candidatus Puniceispirillum sp.]
MTSINILLYAGVLVGWSTSWLPLSWQLGVVAPEISLFWRFLMAAPMMALLALFFGQTLWFDWRVHWRFALLGLCIFSGNFALFYHAGSGVSSGLLAVVFSTASLVNVMMVAMIARTWPPMLHVVAALVGIAGIAMLYWPELKVSDDALQSLVFCLLGTLFFCTGNMVSQNSQQHRIPVFASTAWGMLYGTCYLGIFSLLMGHEFSIELTARYLGSLLWLTVVSSVLTFSCYLLLIGRIGASRAGYATVVFPVFALLISTSFENYHWSLPSMIGLGLVLIGNLIMTRAR